MTTAIRIHSRIAPVALAVGVLGATNWYLHPEKQTVWALGLGTMAVIWLVVSVLSRPSRRQAASQRSFLVLAAITAGLLLGTSLAAALLRELGHYGSLLDRAPGVVLGLVLMVIGNALPKILEPFPSGRLPNARAQSARRFAGWAFTISGVAYAAIWAWAPISNAPLLSMIASGTALVVVLGRWAWAKLPPGEVTPTG